MLMRSERWFVRVLGTAAVIDAVDQVGDVSIEPGRLRVPVVIVGVELPTPTLPTAVAIIWLIGAVLLIAGPVRPGAAAVVVASGLTLVSDQQLYSNHTFLIWNLCLLVTLTWSNHWVLGLTVRTQISVVYVFAALSKLRSPWLSGDVLRRTADGVIGLPIARDLPDRSLTAVALWVIVVELVLAVLVWRGRSVGVVVAGAFHLGIVAVVGNQVGLVVFGIAMLSHFALPALARPASTSKSGSIPPAGAPAG
ncbi:MAG: hypothetical protein R2733_16935 [Acidimicrobiales bacterium]